MTADELDLATPPKRPEPERNGYGHYLVPQPAGKPKGYTRVTTIADALDEKYNLHLWQLRRAAVGLTVRPDLLTLVHAHQDDKDKDNKRKLNGWIDEAQVAGGSKAAANIGTALHRYTEMVDAGEDVEALPPYHYDVAAYKEATADIDLHREYLEAILVNHTHKYAGTTDRLMTMPGEDEDGVPYGLCVGDLKTGSLGDYSWLSFGLQFSMYANAENLLRPTFDEHGEVNGWELQPMPKGLNRRWAFVIHLPAGIGSCGIYRIDIAKGWAAFPAALEAKAIRSASKKWGGVHVLTGRPTLEADQQPAEPPSDDLPGDDVVQDPPAAPAPEAPTVSEPPTSKREELRARLIHLREHHPTQAIKWPDGVPTFKQAAEHTAEQEAAIDKAISKAEAACGAQFGAIYTPTPAENSFVATIAAAFDTQATELDFEGANITGAEKLELGKLLKTLDARQKGDLTTLTAESLEADYPFGLKDKATRRRADIVRAAIAMLKAGGDAQMVRDACRWLTNREPAYLGQLTIVLAGELATLAAALADDRLELSFDNDGAPSFAVVDAAAAA